MTVTTQGINSRRSRLCRALKRLAGDKSYGTESCADRRPISEFVNFKMNPKIGKAMEYLIAKAIT